MHRETTDFPKLLLIINNPRPEGAVYNFQSFLRLCIYFGVEVHCSFLFSSKFLQIFISETFFGPPTFIFYLFSDSLIVVRRPRSRGTARGWRRRCGQAHMETCPNSRRRGSTSPPPSSPFNFQSVSNK